MHQSTHVRRDRAPELVRNLSYSMNPIQVHCFFHKNGLKSKSTPSPDLDLLIIDKDNRLGMESTGTHISRSHEIYVSYYIERGNHQKDNN